jgi:uncharacterized protein DUF6350
MAITPADLAAAAPPPTQPARRRAPLAVATIVATGWAALLSFAPILLLVALAGPGSFLPLVRLASAGWLLAHGVPIETPGSRLALTPLAITVLVLWRTGRAGVHVARATGAHRARTAGPAVVAGASVGVAYGLLGIVAALVAGTPDVSVSTWRAALTLTAVGGIPAIAAALRHSRAGNRLWRRTPPVLGDGLRAGALAAILMLAVGAGAAGLALALSGGRAAEVLGGFHAGVVGQAGVTLVCLAYLPNAAVWAMAYLIGPGFAIGVGTVVSPADTVVAPVPVVPLLAAVPAHPIAHLAPALIAAPVLACLASGWALVRWRGADHPGWRSLLSAAALGALVAGALVAIAAWASAGALGTGRLAEIGPAAGRVGLWATGLAAFGLLAGAASARVLARLRD